MKNLIYIKKTFKTETGEIKEYNQYYLWLQTPLNSYEFVPIKCSGDRVHKMALEASATYFESLIVARELLKKEINL